MPPRVAILGGGLTGVSTALELAAAGMSCLIVETGEYQLDTVRGHYPHVLTVAFRGLFRAEELQLQVQLLVASAKAALTSVAGRLR